MSGQPSELDPATVLRAAAGVAWVPIGDEVVVYRVVPPYSYVLNATAGLLWQCLDSTSCLAEILDDFAVAFGADRGEVEKDCVPVVRTWLAHHLVEEVDGA
jgi:hypothetical protein